MSEPITFQSTAPRHDLPLLFTAQAQKEAVYNEAICRLDALAHPVIEDILSDPPLDPAEGQCWIVGPSSTGAWSGHEDAIAAYSGGDWTFITPQTNMACWNVASSQSTRFNGSWEQAVKPAAPSGGSVVDVESRLAIDEIISALTMAGIIPD